MVKTIVRHALAATCHPDPERSAAAVACLTRAATAAAAGELEDLLLAHRPDAEAPPQERILEMERLKTAEYTVAEPLRAGALLACADDTHADALAEAGALLGTAYQVTDDVLGLIGDPTLTGKAVDADLREGKATVITAHGRRDPAARAALEHLDRVRAEGRAGAAADLADAVARARRALLAAGSVAHAHRVAADLVDRARARLDRLPLDPSVRAELEAAGAEILGRAA